MEPGDSVPHWGLLIIPILSRINPISRLYTYLFKYILILPSYLCLVLPKGLFPVGLPVKILKTLLPYSIVAKWQMTCTYQSSRLNQPDYISATVQNMKFLIVNSSTLPILIQIFASAPLACVLPLNKIVYICVYVKCMVVCVMPFY